MKTTYLHLVVNHLPIVFPVVGIIILLIGIFTQSRISLRNAYIIFILGGIASILAMATGEGAEEGIEKILGASENLIKIHEESAELFAGISYSLAAMSAFCLYVGWKRYSFSKILPYAVLVLSIVTMFFAQNAGNTGGQIRHSEIRTITQSATVRHVPGELESDEED